MFKLSKVGPFASINSISLWPKLGALNKLAPIYVLMETNTSRKLFKKKKLVENNLFYTYSNINRIIFLFLIKVLKATIGAQKVLGKKINTKENNFHMFGFTIKNIKENHI